MSELSDYKRIVEKPMIERYEKTIRTLRTRIAELESAQPVALANLCPGCEGKPAPENNPCGVCGAKALSQAPQSGEDPWFASMPQELADSIKLTDLRALPARDKDETQEGNADAWVYENASQVLKFTERQPDLVGKGYTETPCFYSKDKSVKDATEKTGRHMTWAEERPDQNGQFDELICKNVEMVHIEKMDSGHIWMGIYGDGGRVTVRFSSNRKIDGLVEHEPDSKGARP